MPHNINHGDACLAYFNKIWGIPVPDASHKFQIDQIVNFLQETKLLPNRFLYQHAPDSMLWTGATITHVMSPQCIPML